MLGYFLQWLQLHSWCEEELVSRLINESNLRKQTHPSNFISNHLHSYTVNTYRYKTIEANGNTGVIPTTSKSFSLYRQFLQPL